MKKISVLLILVLLAGFSQPCEAGIFSEQKAKIEQNRIQKTTISEIKALFGEQTKQANKHSLIGLQSLYSRDFVNSDGFNYDTYMKMVEETWETYPDISYNTEIKNIDYTDNYASVEVIETAYASPEEIIGNFKAVGEMYSISKCIYHLEKHGTIWLIASEQILEETSSLKYGKTRHMNIALDAPLQTGAGKYYTVTLKADIDKGYSAIASITKENIVYPQTKSEDVFRRVSNENVLERVFLSNKNNVNEYAFASIALAQPEAVDENHVRLYMGGYAFIMTRINVIPENKYIDMKSSDKGGI